MLQLSRQSSEEKIQEATPQGSLILQTFSRSAPLNIKTCFCPTGL